MKPPVEIEKLVRWLRLKGVILELKGDSLKYRLAKPDKRIKALVKARSGMIAKYLQFEKDCAGCRYAQTCEDDLTEVRRRFKTVRNKYFFSIHDGHYQVEDKAHECPPCVAFVLEE